MQRIDNLTGVRAIAALWVVLYHLNLTGTPVNHRLGTLVAHGAFGVDLFFVLSGFVLTLVYSPRLPKRFQWPAYQSFLVRRFAKIYPLHLLTLLAMIAMVGVGTHLHYSFTSGAENTVRTAICSALMIQAWGFTDVLSWNAASWSVSAEWFAYAVLFMPMVFLLRPVRTRYVAAGTVALLAVYAALTPVFHDQWTVLDTRGALRIVPEFLSGYLLHRFVRGRTVPGGDGFTLVGLVLLVATCYVPRGNQWLLVPAVMVLLAGLHAGGPIANRVFGNRLLVALGDASYSTYLLQTLVLIAAKQVCLRLHAADTVPVRTAIVVLVAVTSSATGLLVFRHIEEPLRLLVLRMLTPRAKNPERMLPPNGPGVHADTQVSATIG